MSENLVDAGPVVEETPPVETPTPTPAGELAKPPVPQKYKLGDEEYDEDALKGLVKQAKTAADIKREGYKKFEEAASIRKQFQGIQQILRANPERGLLELAKVMGVPEGHLDQLFRNRAEAERQWATMTEEQKALYLAREQNAQLQEQLQEKNALETKGKEEKEYAEKLDQAEKLFAKETLPTMAEVGLPQNPLTVKMVAATLASLADREGPDNPPDIREAVDYVYTVWQADRDAFVKSFDKDPGRFTARYPELTKAILKAEVARATGRNPALPARSQVPPEQQPPRSAQTWADFSKQIRALQAGKRI